MDTPPPTLWVTILEGTTPANAKPLFTSADRTIIRAVAKVISERLNPPSRLLQLTREPDGGAA
jgi:hypothetical protein